MKPIINQFLIKNYRRMLKKNPSLIDKAKNDIEKDIEYIREYHKKRDIDVLSKKDTLFKGLNIEEIKTENTSCYLISKEENPSDKVIYYLHGGGFAFGSTCECFEYITFMVRNFHYNVCSIDYRMIPEYNIVDILKDCEDGYNELLKRFDSKDICFMGDSAGGHLVFALSHKLKDDNISLPGGIVALSPVMQFERYSYSYYECSWKTDFGITFGINERIYPFLKGPYDYKHQYVSPLYGDFKDFPKVYIDASNMESLRDEARMAYVKLKEANVDVEYHELDGFFHDQAPQVKRGFVRRIEHPLIKKFLNKTFE